MTPDPKPRPEIMLLELDECHCLFCKRVISTFKEVGMISLKDEDKKPVCIRCSAELLQDSSVGQIVRHEMPMLYNGILNTIMKGFDLKGIL